MGRKIIAALEVSVDGFIEGPNGEMDWAMMEDEETWKDVFEMLSPISTPSFWAERCIRSMSNTGSQS